ncbi:hypothetical protein [Lacticaseibacillus saniviri]
MSILEKKSLRCSTLLLIPVLLLGLSGCGAHGSSDASQAKSAVSSKAEQKAHSTKKAKPKKGKGTLVYGSNSIDRASSSSEASENKSESSDETDDQNNQQPDSGADTPSNSGDPTQSNSDEASDSPGTSEGDSDQQSGLELDVPSSSKDASNFKTISGGYLQNKTTGEIVDSGGNRLMDGEEIAKRILAKSHKLTEMSRGTELRIMNQNVGSGTVIFYLIGTTDMNVQFEVRVNYDGTMSVQANQGGQYQGNRVTENWFEEGLYR